MRSAVRIHEHAVGVVVADVVTIIREKGFDPQAMRLARSLDAARARVGRAGRAAQQSDSRPARLGRDAANRHLPDALTASRAGSMQSLAVTLARITPGLHWSQTEAYVVAPPYHGFLDHYAHATILGPATLAPLLETSTAESRLGVLLLGPHHAYPPHAHPAEEIYLPLTAARWSTGARGTSRVRPAGSLIHHAPELPHAVMTDDVPLLAVYVWLGDTATPSRFLSPDDRGCR